MAPGSGHRSGGRHGRGPRGGTVAIIAAAAVALLVIVAVAVGLATRATPRPAAARKVAKPAVATAAVATTSTHYNPQKPPAPRVPVADPAADQVVPVLMFHHVSPTARNFIAITPTVFDRDMKWLSSNGYHAVSIAQLTDFVQTGKRLPAKPVLITFDDGRMNQYTYAVPILRRYGFTATFFVVKKWVVSSSSSFMHTAELRKLAADGFDIESHSANHTMLYAKPLLGDKGYTTFKARLWGETYGMRVWLQALTGKPVTALAYPGGGHDKYTPRLTADAGYALAFTTDQGFVTYKGPSPMLLPRYNAGAPEVSAGYFASIFRLAAAKSKALASKRPAASVASTP
jgi:peptidoglycan/xylan/chitin deacetylase (PgdA/CDA1 family)